MYIYKKYVCREIESNVIFYVEPLSIPDKDAKFLRKQIAPKTILVETFFCY